MPFYYSGPGQKVNGFDTGRRGNRMQISCTLMAISITLFLKWYKNWKFNLFVNIINARRL